MRIALVGNLNNTLSSIARYLLDEGYDVFLYKFANEPSHFDPKRDMFKNILENRIKILPFFKTIDIFNKNLKSLKGEFRDFDLIIGCGYLPAWFSKLNIRLDIFIPYGSDIYSSPFFKFTFNPKYCLGNYLFSKHQKNGIRNAKLTILEKQSNITERRIERIGLRGNRIYSAVPMLHIPTYEDIPKEELVNLKFYQEYEQIREKYKLVIFHHSRHSWDNPDDVNEQKGNNYLFEGFAEFIKDVPDNNAVIITLEYGNDVLKTKELIKKLNIEHKVLWFPKQSRKELMLGISLSDLVVAELYGDYNLYGTVIEALCAGKPIMQYRVEKNHNDSYKTGLHKAFIADSSDLVAKHLKSLYLNREHYLLEGQEGTRWYQKEVVEPFLEVIQNILKNENEQPNR